MAARHEEGCYEKSILKQFHVCKGLSNDDVGAARGTIFQEIRPGAGFKTGDFVKEMLGGATVERLQPQEQNVVKNTTTRTATTTTTPATNAVN